MTPFLLKAPVKDYIWGGTRLRDEFGKDSPLERLAESWELSCHPDGESVIYSGEFAGMTLSEFIKSHPDALGRNCGGFDRFPVLVKLIDARDDLSVQVHPNDEYARRFENDNGKTEMWYVIAAEEESELVYGLKERLSHEDFRRAVEENTLMDKVNRVSVKQGDVFFIEPGTLHAIGKGILIAEIQQNSNVTYRVYDYGRLDTDGKPRELHVEKALETVSLESAATEYGQRRSIDIGEVRWTPLAQCKYFSAEKLDIIDSSAEIGSPDTFSHILVIDGACSIEHSGDQVLRAEKGNSVFVPAGADTCRIKGKCSIIITTIPNFKEEN